MGITDWYKKTRSLLSKEVRLFNAGETAKVEGMPYLYNWFWSAKLGMPRKTNITELRQYAKSTWIQMVVNAISKQIMTTDWDIVATEEEDDVRLYEKDVEKVKKLLTYPNRNGNTFWELWIPFLKDVLEIDAGVIWKGRNAKGELVELFPFDGSRFLFDIDEHGIVEGYYQYSYKFPKNVPLHYDKEEIIYGRMNLSTEQYPYGWAPLQSVQQEVELMIQSTRWNKEFYKNNAVPDGIVSVPMEKDEMERFKMSWQQEVKGKAHKLIFHNSEGVDFKSLANSNKEMQWLEGQQWYIHAIFAAYGLSPQEVGYYENSNRSTGESQERITVKNAIRPYLSLIADKINREIVPDVVGHDKIQFEWFPDDDVAEKVEHEQTMAKLNASVYTINEVRAMEGKDPVDWGEKPMAMAMQEQMAANGAFDDKDEKEDNPKDKDKKKDRDEKKDDRDKEVKGFKKKVKITVKEVDSGEEMVDEADQYDAFLKKKFNLWEKKIFSFLDETVKEEVTEKGFVYMEKSFGDFIQRLFNVVNTTGFIGSLKTVIKAQLKKGINDAEQELTVDVGFKPEFDKQVEILAHRQLDGFYIDGKRWNGLKGVANDVQKEISELVKEGINEKKGLHTIKNEIRETMNKYSGGKVKGKVTEGRAMKIARTESTRFHNQAKLTAYKESGLKGKKVWDSFFDNRTSSECKELNGQRAGLNEMFKLADGREFESPPSHPNCRSTVRFELDE